MLGKISGGERKRTDASERDNETNRDTNREKSLCAPSVDSGLWSESDDHRLWLPVQHRLSGAEDGDVSLLELDLPEHKHSPDNNAPLLRSWQPAGMLTQTDPPYPQPSISLKSGAPEAGVGSWVVYDWAELECPATTNTKEGTACSTVSLLKTNTSNETHEQNKKQEMKLQFVDDSSSLTGETFSESNHLALIKTFRVVQLWEV